MAARQAGMEGRPQYAGVVDHDRQWTGVINAAPDHIWERPRKKTRPTVYFVNSMSDMFHEHVLDEWIVRAFDIMNNCPHHHFQILTKRPARAVAAWKRLGLNWTDNIWMGASVAEDKFSAITVREISKIPAVVRFISAEPLLESLPSLDVSKVDWVIAGGESGTAKGIRPAHIDWFRDLRDRCAAVGTPFFFKQWGSHDSTGKRQRNKHDAGNLLDGRQHFEMPAAVTAALAARGKSWTIAGVAPNLAAPKVTQAAIGGTVAATVDIATFSKAILALLQSGPLTASQLRSANGAMTDPAKNLHSWALVRLQRAGTVAKRTDQKYGLKCRVKAR